MRHRVLWRVGSVACAVWPSLWLAGATFAVHESTNVLEFETVPGRSGPAGSGVGTIDYRGGDATESRRTATFRFVDVLLGPAGRSKAPATPHVVAGWRR